MKRSYSTGIVGSLVWALALGAGAASAQQEAVPGVGKDGLILEGKVAANDPRVQVVVAPNKSATLPAKRFQVKLIGGKRYLVTMTSTNFDSFLVVQDAAGKQVAFDDDSGGGLDAQLHLDVPQDATVQVFAASLKGVGAFILEVSETGMAKGGRLTAARRQELQQKQRELNAAIIQLYRQGKVPEAIKAARAEVVIARELYPQTDYPKGHAHLARSLNNVGFLLQVQGKYVDAEPILRDALAMLQRLYGKANRPDLALCLNNLGELLYVQGKRADAEPFFRDALAMRQRLHGKADHPDLVVSLNNLGALLKAQGKYADAEPFYRDVLAMRQRLYGKADHPDLANNLNSLGFLLKAQGKHADAEPFYRDALAMRQRLHGKADHPNLALSLNNLGDLLQAQGKYANAEPLYRDALAMRQRLYGKADHADLALSLNNLGILLQDQGKNADAEPLLRDALAMRQRLHGNADHADLASSLNNLGSLLYAQGKHGDAEPFFRDALAMYRRLYGKADHPELAHSLNNLGHLLDAQGKHADAEPLLRDALAMNRRLHGKADHPDLALSLNNLGFLLKAQGKHADAEPFYRDALAMYRRLHGKADHPDLVVSLNNLGVLLNAQGKRAEAEPFYREALAMRQRLYGKADHPDLALSLNNLGHLFNSQGKHTDAEPLLRDALAMRQRLYPKADHPDLALSLNNLGHLFNSQGKHADAEPFYRDALAMRQRLHGKADHPDLALSLDNLGLLLQAQGKHADAEPLLRDALAMYRRLHGKTDHPDLALSLNSLGILLNAQGKHVDAEPLLRDALAMYRRLGDVYAAARSEGEALTRLGVLPLTRDAFLSNARLGQGDPAAVYAEVWLSKAALARAYEHRHLAARAATANPKAAILLADLAQARRSRAELILAPYAADPATREKRTAEIKTLTARVAELETALRPLLPELPRTLKLAKATPADLQKALPADAAVVDFLAYTFFEQDKDKSGLAGRKHTPSYLAFVLTRDKITRVELGSAKAIEDTVRLWREAITGQSKVVPGDIPAKVRELVWEKVRKELPRGIKTVYLAPDLALTALPWAALPGDARGTILLEDFALAVIPHAPFLLDQLWPSTPAQGAKPAGMLVVGGVSYDDAPAKAQPLSLVAQRSGPALAKDKQLIWEALPGAEAEAKGVSAFAGKHHLTARLLSGREASSDGVLAALPQARFAHLATHGFFADKEYPSILQVDPKIFEVRGHERIGAGALSPMVLSGLVLAGANKADTPGRGLITGELLIDRDLSGLELVVLSACETGLGDVAGGEGVFGLQRAFHVAGARNVAASLWKVNDAATAALMAVFYDELWNQGQPPIEALRRAQLAIYRNPKKLAELAQERSGGKFKVVPPGSGAEAPLPPPGPDGRAHPRLWAAFTLSGPGTLSPARKE